MDIFQILPVILLGLFFLYVLFHLIIKVSYFFRWLGMTPQEREDEKKRRLTSYSKSDSGSLWNSFTIDSPSSDNGGGCDSGGSDGGGGSCD